MKLQPREEIKPGQYLSIKTPQGKTLEGKVLSIVEMKKALWVSIRTPKGVRTTSLNY